MGLLLLFALPTSKHKSSPYGDPETRGYIKSSFTVCTHPPRNHSLPSPKEKRKQEK